MTPRKRNKGCTKPKITQGDYPMREHQSTIAVIIFVALITILALLCCCSTTCPAYHQVGNMKPLTPYRK
jgi:hypothetical protein